MPRSRVVHIGGVGGMTPPTVTERLAALTDRAEQLIARGQLSDAQREIALAKRRDPRAAREAIAAARDELRAERIAAEREARRRAVANAPQSLDIAEVIARDRRS